MRRILTIVIGMTIGLLTVRWLAAQVNPTLLETETRTLSDRAWLKLD